MEEQKEQFICNKCSRVFKSKKAIGMHLTWCGTDRKASKRGRRPKWVVEKISASLKGKKLSASHIESLRRSHRKIPQETRYCEHCGTSFVCNSNEKRRYCSQKCANRYTALRVPRETRYCLRCKKGFVVRATSTRKYCNAQCQSKHTNDFISLKRLQITLRHKSILEKKAFLLLDNCFDVSSLSYESIRIPYIQPDGSEHKYVPDCFVTDCNGNSYIIEVKPNCDIADEINQLKFAAGMKYAAKHNFTYLIWTEDIIASNKNGSTTTSIQATVWATAAALSEDNFIGPRYSLTSEEIQRKELKGSFAYEN